MGLDLRGETGWLDEDSPDCLPHRFKDCLSGGLPYWDIVTARHLRTRMIVFSAIATVLLVIIVSNVGNYLLFDFPVEGTSMTPAINGGDLAIVTHSAIGVVHVGDVIVYRNGNVNVIHRVISIEVQGGATALATKGDGNPIPDPTVVTKDDLVGKVVAVVPLVGGMGLLGVFHLAFS
ncbi:MAG TPA: signal peptidase I [Conexivisphaerales archaeon]|nr:signal peptidase I [Conexivisphaerales archaeon]